MKNRDYVKTNKVNTSYTFINEVDGSIYKKNGNKYLAFAYTDKNKKLLERYTKLWIKIKSYTDCDSVEKINDKPGKNEKGFMKIKFNSDDNLPLNKILKLHNLTVFVGSVFKEDGIYYILTSIIV